MSTATYRMYAVWRLQIFAMFGLFAVIGLTGLVLAVARGSGAPLVFVVVWLLLLVWNGYWFLFRIAYRLDLTGSQLRWRTPLRSGLVDLTQLVEMRPHRFGSGFEVLILRDGTKILVAVRKGFVEFAEEVRAAAPHAQIRVGLLARLGERVPGPRGFRR